MFRRILRDNPASRRVQFHVGWIVGCCVGSDVDKVFVGAKAIVKDGVLGLVKRVTKSEVKAELKIRWR